MKSYLPVVPQVMNTIISTFTDNRLWGEGTHLESPSHYYDYSAVFHIKTISQDWSQCATAVTHRRLPVFELDWPNILTVNSHDTFNFSQVNLCKCNAKFWKLLTEFLKNLTKSLNYKLTLQTFMKVPILIEK